MLNRRMQHGTVLIGANLSEPHSSMQCKRNVNTSMHACKMAVVCHHSDIIVKMEAGDGVYARLDNRC